MNIHSSLVMTVYIISRDGVGDGSGLIIKSSFNCILLYYNDGSELARLPLCLCIYIWGGDISVGRSHLGTSGIFVLSQMICRLELWTFLQLPGLQWMKTEPSTTGLQGLREVCRDVCRGEDSGKHTPNPSRVLTLLTPPLFWRLQHFLVSAGVPIQRSQVHL